jgi:hypothetical protein
MLIEELYDALIEAGASEEKSRAAAREVARLRTSGVYLRGEAVYDALIEAGAGDHKARAAARAVSRDR